MKLMVIYLYLNKEDPHMTEPCALISVNYNYRMSRPRIEETPKQQMERRNLAVMVRTARAALGWSQKDLADQLGLSIAAIAKLELGMMRLAPENKAALIKLFENTGIRSSYSAKSVSVALSENILSELNPKQSLSLSWPISPNNRKK